MSGFERWTPAFVAGATIVIVAYATAAALFAPVGATISEVMAILGRRLPVTPLALGIVVGHIYLSGQPPFQALCALARDHAFAVFLAGCLIGGSTWPHRS